MWPFDIPQRNRIAISTKEHVSRRDAKLKGIEIPPVEKSERILSSDISSLVRGIEDGEWTSLDLVHVFMGAAIRAQERTNCLTEVLFDQAVIQAKSLDSHFARTGRLVGPLHGIPISFKDHFLIRSIPTTLGFTSWCPHPLPSSDGAPVTLVKHLGGVPFVKTNVPQSMLAFECNNALFGRTVNPYHPGYTCGGSSGGEAALLAMNGSVVGFGSDIGGSLRIPAGYCGIYSIKPSGRRWPREGSADYAQGFEGVVSTTGIMARTGRDLELVFEAYTRAVYLSSDRGDCGDLGWDQRETLRAELSMEEINVQPIDRDWFSPLTVVGKRNRPLKIGYFMEDGFIPTSPACTRAVSESITALSLAYPRDQVSLIKLEIPQELGGVEGMKIFLGLSSSDGYDRLLDPHLGVDRLDPTLFLPVLSARLPWFFRIVIVWMLQWVLGERMIAEVLRAGGRKSAKEYFTWVERRDAFRRRWREEVWEREGLDAIVCPINASPALPHNATAKLSMLCSLTALFNVLDYSVACLPVTRVKPEQDRWTGPKGEDGRGSWMVRRELYGKGVYDSVKMEGLPVGVQIVTRPFQEEKALGIMKLLDEALPVVEERGGAWRDPVDGKVNRGLGMRS